MKIAGRSRQPVELSLYNLANYCRHTIKTNRHLTRKSWYFTYLMENIKEKTSNLAVSFAAICYIKLAISLFSRMSYHLIGSFVVIEKTLNLQTWVWVWILSSVI